jgi:hypothetical protein
MRIAIHQPQYLPWLGYLDKIDRAELFIVLNTVQFKKNEWQNRNRIRTAQGWQWLTVPVLHRFGQTLGEVRINPSSEWQSKHLRALEVHYARAPFRDPVLRGLACVLEQQWDRLADLNLAVLRWMLDAFGIKTPLRLASELRVREGPTDRLVDLCRAAGATHYLAGAGAAQYMDVPRFEASGVKLELQNFRHPVYPQCYEPFVPGLSALDLLLMRGEEALAVLRSAPRDTEEERYGETAD